MAMTKENLMSLADLAEGCAAPEIAVHLHVYMEGRVLLEWHDSFFRDPLYVSTAVAEETVQHLCSKLGTRYENVSAEADRR
jgi:hypothetical protein